MSDPVIIHDLFVLKEYRHKGIASKLYGMISDNNKVKVAVLKDNSQAISFYESKGIDIELR